jgi:hypothetical protein
MTRGLRFLGFCCVARLFAGCGGSTADGTGGSSSASHASSTTDASSTSAVSSSSSATSSSSSTGGGSQINGTPCGAAADCKSGFCVDGVCCDVGTCDGCYACSVPGAEGTCCGSLSCAIGGCDGAGACTPAPAGTVCQTDSCAGFTAVVHVCDGTATSCPSATMPQQCPGNLKCADATSCKASCSQDSDCNGGWCNGGTCAAGLSNGQACTHAAQCMSSICDRGHCAICQFGLFQGNPSGIAYQTPNANVGNALCYPTTDGTNDPSKLCSQYADGNAACAAAGVGNSCTSGVCQCSSPMQCTSAGAPSCLADPNTGGSYCGCYVAPNGAIPSGVFGCYTGYACVSGACKTANGYSCTTGSECASSNCSLGYCQ